MNVFKWKSFIITGLICLSPILLGLALWNSLPDSMAIHFNIHNQPDNFAPKGVVVFLLPALMLFAHFISCLATDINAHKHGESKKFENVIRWLIPIFSIVMQVITLGYGLGWDIDIRRVVVSLVGIMFIVLGNYLPKLNYIKNYDIDTEKARKINRFVGFATVIMGILALISIFLPVAFSIAWLILMIPYTLITLIHFIKNK